MPVPSLLAAARRLLLLAAALLAPALAAVPASAGQFHVYACKTPAGHAVALPNTAKVAFGEGLTAVDNCGTPGGVASLRMSGIDHDVGAVARFEMTPPSGMTVARLTYKEYLKIAAASDPEFTAQPEWTLYRNGSTKVTGCAVDCTGWPLMDGGFDLSTSQATALTWEVQCAAKYGNGMGLCISSHGGDRVTYELHALHLLVNENTAPSGTASGPMTELARPHVGTENATIAAADSGAGVYQAYATLDGVPAGRVGVDTTSCSDRGNDASDLDFESFTPCPTSRTLTVPVNTKVVGDGPAQLRLVVRDAAGNETTVFDRSIDVLNNGPLPTPAPGSTPTPAPGVTPPPTDVGAAPAGRLTLDGKKPSRVVRGGRKAAITGRLVGLSGQPLGGASVTVSERLQVAGAAWSPVARIATDAKGAFSYAPTTTASRTLRFAYAFGTGGALEASQTFELRVTAPISIRSGTPTIRRGGTVKLTGTVGLAHLPAKGARLEIQVRSGKKWQSIDRAKVSRSGRWSWTYALARSTHSRYVFRAFLPSSGDVPAEPSSSSTVTVRVRR